MFQMTFAIITPALVIGGFAERMRFSAVLWFSVLWLLVVYVPIAHWVWGGGWLAKLGVMDFAGGIVVHVSAGVAALVCAVVLGKRRGFPHTAMTPHSLPFTVAGARHAVGGLVRLQRRQRARRQRLGRHGDARHAHGRLGRRARVDVRRSGRKYGKPSMLGVVTGMVAGLGTITPASGFVGPMGAVAIGLSRGHGVLLRDAVPQAQARDRRLARRLAGARRRWRHRHVAHRRVRCGVRSAAWVSPCRKTCWRRWVCRHWAWSLPRRGARCSRG